MKGYLECQVLRWRSITWEMRLKEVKVLIWLLNILYIYVEYTPPPPPHPTHCGALIMWGSVLLVFPAGEDPLAEQRYDLDSVAGVLKLYFRGLTSPLFPTESTSQLLEQASKFVCEHWNVKSVAEGVQQELIFPSSPVCSEIKNEAERATQLKAVISTYPKPIIIVMRYLFAFLHQWVF